MFNVCRLTEDQDGAVEKKVIGAAGTREEAEVIINAELKRFTRSGRNEEHDYWWGRNEGPARVRFFVEGS